MYCKGTLRPIAALYNVARCDNGNDEFAVYHSGYISNYGRKRSVALRVER